MPNGYCGAPFVEGFCGSSGGFRNCCVVEPQIRSDKDQDFQDWWHGDAMEEFRSKFYGESLPPDCFRCEIDEKVRGNSLRLVINKDIKYPILKPTWPSRWHLTFGNLCNLGCWTCSEHASSIIESDKKKLKLIPIEFDSHTQHERMWLTLQDHVLESYRVHQGVINLTIQGGEPLYNKSVIDFLRKLKDRGLSNRTRLEFHTNATQFSKNISDLLDLKSWHYICAFVSVDAVGKKAEWLRYGTRWPKVETNIRKMIDTVNFVELQATLSIMNLRDLPAIRQLSTDLTIPMKANPVTNPWFMSIANWDRNPDLIANRSEMYQSGFGEFYEKIGSESKLGCSDTLVEYIKQFDGLRRPLRDFDLELAGVLGL